MAFVGVVAMTLALATWILPDGSAVAQGGAPSAGAEPSDATPSIPSGPPTREGGSLALTGDRTGTLGLDSVQDGGPKDGAGFEYELSGGAGRVRITGAPPVLRQLSFEGLNFITDSDDCTITPGELNQEAGIGWADIDCEDLTDVRDTATVSISGRLGVAAVLLGLTDDLPKPGGSVLFGDRALAAEWATFTMEARSAAYGIDYTAMAIGGRDPFWQLEFGWDARTDRLMLSYVSFGDGTTAAGPDACTIDRRVLGRHSPRWAMVEVDLDCEAVEVPGLGVTGIRGTVVVTAVQSVRR